MAVIQISKIQVRRGPSNDLPGKPLTLAPATFEDGLDTGEFGFTTDQGRLFIGNDPSVGHANFARTTFPYQNIEVLTENSTDILNGFVSAGLRSTNSDAYYEAVLPPAPSVWTPVTVPTNGIADYQFRLVYGLQAAACISYAAYDSDGDPVRSGTLTVFGSSDGSEPDVVDEAAAVRRFDLTVPDAYSPEEMFGELQLRFSQAGATNARYLAMEYLNLSSTAITLRFRVSDPRP